MVLNALIFIAQSCQNIQSQEIIKKSCRQKKESLICQRCQKFQNWQRRLTKKRFIQICQMAKIYFTSQIEEDLTLKNQSACCNSLIQQNIRQKLIYLCCILLIRIQKSKKYSVSASKVLGLLKKYSPETKTEKKQRLTKLAEQKAQAQKGESKKVQVLKFGLNHVTTLVETKKAKLVLLAYDVDPIELVVWLPQLCRRQEVPFCFIKNKARLGALVHQKTATCVALTDVRKEDQAEFDNLARDLRQHYNENHELLRTIGGGQVGIKSRHQQEAIKKAFELEELKKTSQ